MEVPLFSKEPEMEKTPLELYETAYKYHYCENRISDAVKIYEKLISEFPDSNECGYAAIQIQKIKASDIVNSLRKDSKPRKGGVTFWAVSCIVVIFLAVCAGFYVSDELKTSAVRNSLISDAISKMLCEEYDDALDVISELKKVDSTDIAPYELSAFIYRKKGHYAQAKSEYDTFFKLNPNRIPTAEEKSVMQKTKNIHTPLQSSGSNRVLKTKNRTKK